MITENLLIELGTEELPPKSLRKLAEALSDGFKAELVSNNLAFESINWLASPRRLAINVLSLQTQQDDKLVEKRGPSIQAAFDSNGNATKAAEGWAKSNGISVAQADRLKTDKGEWLFYKSTESGKPVTELVGDMFNKAVAKLPIPKPMRWGDKTTRFIRPVHTVTALLGANIVEIEVLGVKSSNIVRGHRFHGSQKVIIDHADNYESLLEKEYVIADFEKRKEKIVSLITEKAQAESGKVTQDNELLEEVNGLVEWPVALVANFDESFLRVPKEALIYTMKDDQKYFPLLDHQGELLPKFIFISNIESKNPAAVISGNERVVRPRLADAQFFFDTDLKTTLAEKTKKLSSIVFQKQLGTLQEKSQRVAELARFIAADIGAQSRKQSSCWHLVKG